MANLLSRQGITKRRRAELRRVCGKSRWYYVVESAPWAWPDLEDELETGSSPMDAMLLGQRLRLLAAVLGALLPPEDLCFDDWNAGRDGARPGGTSFARPAVAVPFGLPQGLYDTS